MYKKISKLLISVLTIVILFLGFSSNVMAQSSTGSSIPPWYSQDFGSWYAKVYGGDQNQIFGERYTAAQTQWVFYGITSMIINSIFGQNLNLTTCLVSTQATGNAAPCIAAINGFIDKLKSSFTIGDNQKSSSVISEIFNDDRPISGITYVKNIGRKFNIIPEAKAAPSAGFGYTSALGILPAIQDMWKVMRNLSYAIFVVIIIVFAFMIMFRIKISPQVVISVQSALPKIAITLILVTFSYAIAGFLIDLMYVVIGIFSLIFSQVNVFGVGFVGLQGIGINQIQGYFDLLTKGPAFLGQGLGVFGLMVMYLVNIALGFFVTAIGGIIIGWCGGGGGLLGSTLGGLFLIIGIIAFVVILIISIINFFKIVIVLAKAFLSIILLTIFAPLMLTLGAIIPGLSFGSWLKSYVSKLAVFPAVGVMFILSLWLIELAWESIHSTQCSVGVLGGPNMDFAAGWPPLLGGSRQMVALAFLFASMAIFAMIPKVADMIESFMAGKAFNFGSAIGEGFAPVSALGMGGLQTASSVQQQSYAEQERKAQAAAARGGYYAISNKQEQAKTAMDVIRTLGRGRIK